MADDVMIPVKYQRGHTMIERWVAHAETFCPECGNQGVYARDYEPDYYQGAIYLCPICEAVGHEWNGTKPINDNEHPQRIAAIRSSRITRVGP